MTNKVKKYDIIFVEPWGNMCDYYSWLIKKTNFKSSLYTPSINLFSLARYSYLLNKVNIKQAIEFQLLLKKGKLSRKGNDTKTLMKIKSISYWLKFAIIFTDAISTLKRNPCELIAVWNGHRLKERAVSTAAQSLGIPVVFFENGFLPNTTLIDPNGVNVNCSLPNKPSFYLSYLKSVGGIENLHAINPNLSIREVNPDKTKISPQLENQSLLPEKYIFIPFQVDVDSQVLINSRKIKSMYELYYLINDISKNNPDWTFIVKEHPSCVRSYETLHHINGNIKFSTCNTQELICNASAVVTLNSSVGIEALLQFKPVIVLGDAAYDITGITKNATNIDELQLHLSDILTNKWIPDTLLIKTFLNYLENTFLVTGSWRTPSKEHLNSLEEKLTFLFDLKIKN